MVGKLSYYQWWIVAFAFILFQKGVLTPDELARKMAEVEARLSFGAEFEAAEHVREKEQVC